MSLPALLIPAYKPGAKLVGLVEDLAKGGYPQILVVNDGSGTEFEPVFSKLRGISGVKVIEHAVNLGKGAALKFGMNHLLVHHKEISGVVTVDADGQHLPKDVAKVAAEFSRSPEKMHLGSRAFKGDVPFRSAFGNMVTAMVFRLLIGKKLVDTQTGLRAIPKAFIPRLLRINASKYEFELEMLINAISNHVEIIEVPIETVYEPGNPTSHFNPLLDSLRIYFVFLRFVSLSLFIILLDLGIFSLVFNLSGNLFAGMISGRACGLLIGIYGSKFYVFKSDRKLSIVAVKILALWGLLLALSYGLLWTCVNALHFNAYLSRIGIDSTLFFLNFLIQRLFIFNRPR